MRKTLDDKSTDMCERSLKAVQQQPSPAFFPENLDRQWQGQRPPLAFGAVAFGKAHNASSRHARESENGVGSRDGSNGRMRKISIEENVTQPI